MTPICRRAIPRLLLAGVTLVAAVSCASARPQVAVGPVASGASADFSYVIPAGTGTRIDEGQSVDIIPADIDARVGQVIRIENQDTRGHVVGPFFVGRGETMTQRFTSPGTLRGTCSVHPNGAITVTVRP